LESPTLQAPPAPGAGLFLWGGDRRVGACASADELVSLGFRVGNPSAIGWYQRASFQASLLPVGVIPTTSRQSRAQFASENGQKPSGAVTRPSTQEGRNHPPRGGIFLSSEHLPGSQSRIGSPSFLYYVVSIILCRRFHGSLDGVQGDLTSGRRMTELDV
jgi:hypothetical protein